MWDCVYRPAEARLELKMTIIAFGHGRNVRSPKATNDMDFCKESAYWFVKKYLQSASQNHSTNRGILKDYVADSRDTLYQFQQWGLSFFVVVFFSEMSGEGFIFIYLFSEVNLHEFTTRLEKYHEQVFDDQNPHPGAWKTWPNPDIRPGASRGEGWGKQLIGA